jgi:hypothetical protein
MLLRNRRAGGEVLRRIGANPEWVAAYEVKKMLVLHPRSPRALSNRLIRHLYWNDLADASDSPRLPPAARRRAEEILESRVRELALGEQISLARRATRGLIPRLLEGQEPRVMRSLLSNERLLETEATAIADSHRAPAALLGFLSTHPRWGSNRAVRVALLNNSRTPVASALGLLRKLHRNDLLALESAEGTPTIVKIGAARELERDRHGETNA